MLEKPKFGEVNQCIFDPNPQMVRAGVEVLFQEYNNTFDPLENDADSFVRRIYQAMARTQRGSN